jgi:hypothetical protein
MQGQVESLRSAVARLPGPVQGFSVSDGVSRTKFAGAADHLACWYWDDDDLVPDGVFDIRQQ